MNDAMDTQLLPTEALSKLPRSIAQLSDISDASSIQGDSRSDSPESHSSVGEPSPTVEKQQTLLSSTSPTQRLDLQLAELFAENVVAKIWKVAVRELEPEKDDGVNHSHPRRFVPPASYPEYVTISGPEANKYTMTEADFWTCGFFPGSLYTLLERAMKYPQYLPIPASHRSSFTKQLLKICNAWSGPIRAMDTRTDTHDMGFIIQPALRMDWELNGNEDSLKSVVTAAYSLASRYDEKVGAIRSWDDTVNYRYSFTSKETDYLVIIDSMCNLDLLYYAGHQTGDQKLIDIATTHAHTVLRAIVRDDWSTYHLINFDPNNGTIKNQLTCQGYQDWSTWARGQSWAILGFTQTYTWTRDPIFLHAAISLANYFLSRLSRAALSGTHSHPYVPLWDFDAPPTATPTGPLRDTSAAMIASNGMLLLHQVLIAEGRPTEAARFLEALLRIVRETLELSLAEERSAFGVSASAEYPVVVEKQARSFDAILKNATANNNEYSHKIYRDHGLVYADYYFLELGNKLLRMGLV